LTVANDNHYQELVSGYSEKFSMSRFIGTLVVMLAFAVAPVSALARDGGSCPRPNPGTLIQAPPDLFSFDGVLNASFEYYTTVDSAGRTLFCFVTPHGLQSPTLHLRPGDTLNLSVTNRNPPPPPGSPTEIVANPLNRCGDVTMTITSLNVHLHGTNTSPRCHSDQVVHTIINSGETFKYSVKFPPNEPPGLYWYHPHVHGLSEAAVQGGASGAIIVEGIENVQPGVAGLPERVLMIRDQISDPSISSCQTPGATLPSGAIVPSWDVSLNYVPILCPRFHPAVINMKPGQQEFWRVVNASADTIIDLQVQYDGKAQALQIVALDGVPTGSQDGTMQGQIVTQTDVLLAPAARAEFIVTGPSAEVKSAQFLTLNVDTGPDGDADPTRSLASIVTTASPPPLPVIAAPSKPANHELFEGLAKTRVTAHRTLYFSEVLSDPSNPASPTNFFITVDGAAPVLFDPNNPPAIVTIQGAVEDWTIQNRSQENHEFHMHQIHFLLLEQNGVPLPPEQSQYLDMIQVPYWSGTGPYPSVTVRMDFRGMDIGDFVYHCHILGHEDAGMMATIRVLPPVELQ
jgi:FtsP/CotA-like multicopper oxidase with cupredoxin domain